MILFNRFSGNVIYHTSDISGHWLMMVIEFNDANYIFVYMVITEGHRTNNFILP